MDDSTKRRLILGFLTNWVGKLSATVIQFIQIPVFLHFWSVPLYGEWMIVNSIPAYLSFSNAGFGSVAGNEMTMMVARDDRDGALRVFQSCWWLIAIICTATILLLSINDQMKLFGFWNMKVSELAVCGLDSNTLAIGDLGTVRAAIDAGKKGRASSDLATLATRDPNAVLGFGANVPSALLANLNVGNDTIAKDAKSIRQIYGSLGSIENDVSLMLVARTDTADAAKNLSDTFEGLKQLGGILITRMQQPRKALAQSALDNLRITTRGNEVEIRTRVDAANLASVIK